MNTVRWHKSSYSGGTHQDCVEVAESEFVLVRDTQNRDLGHLTFHRQEWANLLNTLQR
ncbi:DUF397 domain-containing protein [Nocardiopsis valliformis]|uniref:DUF397 domain-containing protein n=1 Tax=Nocardiopsis valliformis TaxID=239974 RepID=UPI00034841C7|nr:DUF397 domain-containing protein [Nocardiopsis valliformis]